MMMTDINATQDVGNTATAKNNDTLPHKPRIVSFNRDVHVKRIGRPRDILRSPHSSRPETPSPQPPILKKEPFTNLSKEQLSEEAAKVVAQAGGITCSADGPEKFFSLPYRKKLRDTEGRGLHRRRSEELGVTSEFPNKKLAQSVTGSYNDFNLKKTRSPRNSLSSIFRRPDRDLSYSKQEEQRILLKPTVKRSKSDVTDLSSHSKIKPIRKRAGSESEEYLKSILGKKSQLSPIIEVNPKDDYFKKPSTVDDKADNNQTSKLDINQTPDIIISTPTPVTNYKLNPLEKPPRFLSLNDIPRPPKRTKRIKPLSEKVPLPRPTNKFESKTRPAKTSLESNPLIVDEIDLRVRDKDINPIDIKKQIKNTIDILEKKFKINRNRNMVHSSQKPPDKLPLTKGQTVDPLVKFLKEDRFSPPPRTLITPPNPAAHNNNQPFSYIRPSVSPDPNLYTRSPSPARPLTPVNKSSPEVLHNIVYAEVKRNGKEIGNTKQTIHTTYTNGKNRSGQFSDEDEGLGYEENRNSKYLEQNDYLFKDTKYEDELYKNIENFVVHDSPITPRVREFKSKYFDYEPTYANEFLLGKYNNSAVDPTFRGRGDGMDSKRKDYITDDVFHYDSKGKHDLSYRRNLLESRMQARRFGEKYDHNDLPGKRSIEKEYNIETVNPMEATRKYVSETRKYYRDSSEKQGFMDKYSLESTNDRDGKEHKIEQRSRLKYNPVTDDFEPLSTKELDRREFIDKMLSGEPKELDVEIVNEPRKYFPPEPEYEPPSLDSNFTRQKFSPDEYLQKKYRPKVIKYMTTSQDALDTNSRYVNMKTRHEKFGSSREHYASNPEIAVKNGEFDSDYPATFHNSLKRDKARRPIQNRYDLDRDNRLVDSGIENDYRKDSSGDINTKDRAGGTHWRRGNARPSRTDSDDEGFASLQLIASERQHTEWNFYPLGVARNLGEDLRDSYTPRERSIDDGSHYDPRIDRLERTEDVKMSTKPPKASKKISGLEKVRQLFSRDSSKKSRKAIDNSPPRVNNQLVREESLPSRYREYRGSSEDRDSDYRDSRRSSRPSKTEDVSRPGEVRQIKVTTSRRSVSPVNYDYSQRRRLATPSPSPSPPRARPESTPPRERRPSPQRPTPPTSSSWFKSLDRLTRKKTKTKNENDSILTAEEDSSIFAKSSKPPMPSPAKNLRFFGDTDIESDPSVSRATSVPKQRTSSQRYTPEKSTTLARTSRNLSSSAQAINSLDRRDNSYKSSSLTNLQEERSLSQPRNTDHKYSNKRNLHNISEIHSASEIESFYGNDTCDRYEKRRYHETKSDRKPPMSPLTYDEKQRSRSQGSSKLNKDSPMRESKENLRRNGYISSRNDVRNGEDSRGSSAELSRSRQELNGSRSDLKSGRRRKVASANGGAGSADSSTEGDSSQQSQRSIVYLHATTVGDIPGPERISRGRSRDDVSSVNSSRLQPQVKTVTRSFSLLAPWRPRHRGESLNINYSQSQNGTKKSERSTRSAPINDSTLSHTKRKSASTRNLNGSRQDFRSIDDHDGNPTLMRKSKMATSKSVSNSNNSLYRKPEKKRDMPIRDYYVNSRDYDRDHSKSRSTEALAKDSYSRHPSSYERDRISRSISMPKSPNKSAGWFKIKSAKKIDNGNRMR